MFNSFIHDFQLVFYLFYALRFPTGQQLVTKLVTAPMACGAVMVPTSMFMGQVVTAYNPFTGQQVGTKQRRRIVLWLVIGIVQSVKSEIKMMFRVRSP